MDNIPYLIVGAGNNPDFIIFATSEEDARDLALDDYGRSQIYDVREATAADINDVLASGKAWNDDELKAWLRKNRKTKK